MPRSKKLKVPSPELPHELGKYIARDVDLLSTLGWTKFVKQRRQRGDFSSLSFDHPASRILHHYKVNGAPVKLSTKPWSDRQLRTAIQRGPHRSCIEYIDFLEEEFIDMIRKEQWVILPYSVAKSLPDIRLSPPGVVPQRGRRPRWICDYTWYGVNDDTLPLAPLEAMQFGHALDRYLRELLLSDPKLGPLYMLKLDISDGFYRINLAPTDIPRLGVVFPSRPGQEKLVALPLVLPMGWKNSPPIFSAATETSADIANCNLQANNTPAFHPLEVHAAALDIIAPATIPLPSSTSSNYSTCTAASSHSAPSQSPTATPSASPTPMPPPRPHSIRIPVPKLRDPCLPSQRTPTKYVDVFVDDFIAIVQGESSKAQVRQVLLHAVDAVFRPCDFYDGPFRREPVSLKKLRQGDLSWNTIKLVLGWVINTTTMTIELPPHRQERLGEILASIPLSQKRLSVKKWHKVLGELRSMSLALPGARNLFSTLQKALSLANNKCRIALNKGVHNTINDFRWLYHDICNRKTRIAEVVPLNPCALGYHDAAGPGAGGVWYPNPELTPRTGLIAQPLVWRLKWPQDIIDNLVTEHNPKGTVTNSDLELAGGLLHLDIAAQHFDIRERTILSKTDNLATMFWQRKGSATSTKPPAHLLRLFGLHQRFHRYVPRHDYIPGPSNPMADDASRLFHLSNSEFLSYFNQNYSQSQSYLHVTPTSQMSSAVISALRSKTCSVASLLVDPAPPAATGLSGSSTPISWASTPYSKPSKIKYPSFKSSYAAFAQESWLPADVRSSLARLRSTYGLLHRRTSPWGPLIQG